MPSTYHPGIAGKMPMKGRRASATKTVHTAVPQVDPEQADIEDFAPPEWRTVLNNRADLGYPDFYPSRPGFNQTEDVLTEEFVKNGFSAKTFVAVGAESFSMHGPIFGHLMNGCLGMLNRLGQEIAQKRDEAMPQIGERAFRIPVRVTYNDTKRLQFLADLANPSVPLHRLMRSPVPHGFKGTELFESMFSPQLSNVPGHNRPTATPAPTSQPIPLDRAIWFIRVLGANEISAHRGRAQPIMAPVAAPSPIPATPSSTNTAPAASTVVLSSNDWYTQEFTTMFSSWLRIQLGQLALPSKITKSGATATKGPMGVLGDEKARTRWLAKWDYSIKVLVQFRIKHLISTRIFVSWLADTLATANLAQVGFVAQLIGDLLPEMSRHTIIARVCVRAACAKIDEIQSSPASDSLSKIESMLKHVITVLVDADPLVLLSPSTWRYHRSTIEALLASSPAGTDVSDTPTGSLRTPTNRKRVLDEMKRISEDLMFKPSATESTTSPRRQQMEDLHKLDAMDADTNMTNLCKSYFDGPSSPTTSVVDMTRLEEKTFVLLNWAMGLFQLGVHRAYAVDTLLTTWTNLYNKAQAKLPKPKAIDFFTILYKWLDTSDAAHRTENAFAIGITFGDLTRQGLFSYRRYLQVLVAEGHSARSRAPGKPPSHHLPLLAAMPIFVQAKDLLQQRRLTLCGDDEEAKAKLDQEEERLMDEFRQEVKEYIPELFGLKEYGRSASLRESVYHQMPSAPALNRHLFLQVRFWLAPAAADSLKRQGNRSPIDASTFVRVIHVFHLCNGYSTTADFLIKALEWNDDDEILDLVIDTIRRDADVWTANDKWALLTNALMDRNHAQDEKGRHHSGLAGLLLELARRGRLSDDDEEEVRASIEKHPKDSKRPAIGWVDAAEIMGPLHQAISTGNIAAAKILAPKLFSRHGPYKTWSTLWWTTLVQAIQASQPTLSSAVVDASLAHIEEVDDNTDATLDSVIEKWLEDLSQASVLQLLSSRVASPMIEVLLNLIAHRRLRIVPRILEKLVYTIWKLAATSVIASKGRISANTTQAVTSCMVLAQQLLLTTPPNPDLPPINLRQSLVLQTERGTALNGSNVPTLIRHLPFLVILDKARGTPDKIREQISTLLRGLARTPQFKAAAFRHLPILKDAFLSNEWGKPGMEPGVESGMVDALKLIMSQSSSTSSAKLETIASLDPSTKFSAWRWTSVVLSMRVEFKRLAMRIENGEEPDQARQTLKELVHATLDRDASADDTDLLCETFRGIEPVAAQEIVAVGMERLTVLLSQMLGAENQAGLDSLGKTTDLMLRVLDSASMAPTAATAEHSVLAARHGLLDLISVALQAIERQLTSDDGEPLLEGVVTPKPEDLFAIVLKLIKFTLGLSVAEPSLPAQPRPDFGRLASSFFRVIVAVSDKCNVQTIESLVAVLVYIVDSAPSASRASVHAALMAEMSSPTVVSALTHRPAIISALPYTSPPRRPVVLSNPNMGDGTDSHLPLDDRPWEMFEALDPPADKVKHGEMFLATKPLRDTASIPMSLFGPQMKRDIVPCMPDPGTDRREEGVDGMDPDEGDGTTWDDYASERNLGDGQAGEPLAVRQLATSLYANPEESTADDDAATVRSALSPIQPASATLALPSSPAVSSPSTAAAAPAPAPAAGRPRRASTRLSAPSGQAVRPQTGSNRDPITFEDSEDDEPESESESEPEPLEMPVGKRPRRGGKTVGGKTTRKTTGGKGVPRKVVGGKGVRSVSGKSVRGGRRRSIAD